MVPSQPQKIQGYSKWERRAPLCPSHVRELTNEGISVLVQPSKSRIFGDHEVSYVHQIFVIMFALDASDDTCNVVIVTRV